jgi:hypothetical protein
MIRERAQARMSSAVEDRLVMGFVYLLVGRESRAWIPIKYPQVVDKRGWLVLECEPKRRTS